MEAIQILKKDGMVKASRQLSISVTTLYKWQSVYESHGEEGLSGKISQNKDWEHDYIIKVFYHSRDLNDVYILNPNVIKHPDLHISKEGLLCLYYPLHISRFKNFWVTQDLIFQTIKWIYCYESWKLNGHKWKCDEMPHGRYARVGRWPNLEDVHLGLNNERPQS